MTFQDEFISSYCDWSKNLSLKCQNFTRLSLNLSNVAWSEPMTASTLKVWPRGTRNFPYKMHFIRNDHLVVKSSPNLYNHGTIFLYSNNEKLLMCLECCHFAFIVIVMQLLHVAQFAIQDKDNLQSNLADLFWHYIQCSLVSSIQCGNYEF